MSQSQIKRCQLRDPDLWFMMLLPPGLRILLQAQSRKPGLGSPPRSYRNLLITKQVTISVPLNLYKFHVKEVAGILRDIESQQKRHTRANVEFLFRASLAHVGSCCKSSCGAGLHDLGGWGTRSALHHTSA